MRELKDVTEYITPKDVSKELHISPETLRKYANLIDKISQKNFFTRDSQNARMYSKEDVTLLKRIITLKNTVGITLEKATEKALYELNENLTTVNVTKKQNDQNDVLREFQAIMQEQKETISKYEKIVLGLIESNANLTEQVQSMLEIQEQLSLKLIPPENEESSEIEEAPSENDLQKMPTDKRGFFFFFFRK